MGKPNPQNLIPMKKGDPTRNPNGRKGKNGKGGFSILGAFRKQINEMDPIEFKMVLNGLIEKAMSGDTKAIELLIKINAEKIEGDTNAPLTNTVIINMPNQESNDQ